MEEVYKVTVSCPYGSPSVSNRVCKNGMTVYTDRQGAWTGDSKKNVADRLAQHLSDVHVIQWIRALPMAYAACDKAEFWTDYEKAWEADPRQDLGQVILTSPAAAPIGASASSRDITARSRTPTRDDLPLATLAMIQNMPVQSLWALIHAAQHETSQRTTH